MAEKNGSEDGTDGFFGRRKLYSVAAGGSAPSPQGGRSGPGCRGVTLNNKGFPSTLTIINNQGCCIEVFCEPTLDQSADSYSLAIRKRMDPNPQLSIFHVFRGDNILRPIGPESHYYVFEKTALLSQSGGAVTSTDSGSSTAQQLEYYWLGRTDSELGLPLNTVRMLNKVCPWPPVEVCNSPYMAWFLYRVGKDEVYDKLAVPKVQRATDAHLFPGPVEYLYGKLKSTECEHYLAYNESTMQVTITDIEDDAAYFRFGPPT